MSFLFGGKKKPIPANIAAGPPAPDPLPVDTDQTVTDAVDADAKLAAKRKGRRATLLTGNTATDKSPANPQTTSTSVLGYGS